MTRGYLASLAQARADTQQNAEEEARADADPCSQEENLLAVQLILDRLHDTLSPVDDLDHQAVPEGELHDCAECDHGTTRIYLYGPRNLTLCRRCATRRLELASRLEREDAERAATPTTERAAA